MVIAALSLLAAVQAAPQAEVCTLVTPRGDAVHVAAMAWSSDGSRLGLVPVSGGVWPREAIVGTRVSTGHNRGAPPRFVFGDAHGLVFELGPRLAGRTDRAATLFRNGADGPGLPLAFGYCAMGPAPAADDAVDSTAQPASAVANIPAFDPALWPESDCAMLFGDGRQARVNFDLQGRDSVAITSPALWDGHRVVADLRWLDQAAGVFDHDGGPTGTAANYGAGSSAVKLIRFQRFGGGAPESLNGYAICGYAAVVRRAAQQ